MGNIKRSTTVRDRHRADIARGEPPCHICGAPIDYTLPHLDPGQFVVDHIVPIAKGGTDTIDNKAAAHRWCNRMKSDKTEGSRVKRSGSLARTFVTDRTW